MFIRVEPSSGVPVTGQIADQVRTHCASGTLRPGDRLPSVRELARQLAVNPNTVLRVYERLDSMRDPGALRPWIAQVTRRLCLDRLAAAKGEPETAEPDEATSRWPSGAKARSATRSVVRIADTRALAAWSHNSTPGPAPATASRSPRPGLNRKARTNP